MILHRYKWGNDGNNINDDSNMFNNTLFSSLVFNSFSYVDSSAND
jgi:hypothetical protein